TSQEADATAKKDSPEAPVPPELLNISASDGNLGAGAASAALPQSPAQPHLQQAAHTIPTGAQQPVNPSWQAPPPPSPYAAQQTVPANAKPKSNIRAVWAVIVAILAIPVGLPLAAVLAAIILVVLAVLFSLLVSLAAVAVSLLAAGIFAVVSGFVLLFSHFATGLFYVGIGLAAIGFFLLIGFAAGKFGHLCIGWVAKFFNSIRKRLMAKERVAS
ncbi:MAG: hypothetical protein LBG81_08950, partial [Coriobacteriaceae bacterium]|nr:hypothetical protein [Coriobacteriaceae bacterium]